jgi:hypothetical protein
MTAKRQTRPLVREGAPIDKTVKKGKVVPVLNLIKHYTMKAYGGVDV